MKSNGCVPKKSKFLTENNNELHWSGVVLPQWIERMEELKILGYKHYTNELTFVTAIQQQ